MKVLASLSGTAAVNIPGEQTCPLKGVIQRDVISYLKSTYNFLSTPSIIDGNLLNIPVLQFQAGIFFDGEENIPIQQIIATTDGDAVTAQNTELADIVLSNYMLNLEDHLHFRFSEWAPSRLYQSVLFVELDEKFAGSIFSTPISNLVSEALGNSSQYSLKRLTLGQDASNAMPARPSIRQFLPRDFVIERRANEPMEANRFFCTAPMTTPDHIAVLQKIEASVL